MNWNKLKFCANKYWNVSLSYEWAGNVLSNYFHWKHESSRVILEEIFTNNIPWKFHSLLIYADGGSINIV